MSARVFQGPWPDCPPPTDEDFPEGRATYACGDDIPHAQDHRDGQRDDAEKWQAPDPLPKPEAAPSLFDDCGDGRQWLDTMSPPKLASFISAVATANELPPENVAAGAVPAAALAVGPNVLVQGYNTEHFETMSVWCVSAEPPGHRKSAGLSAATKPLAKLAEAMEAEGALEHAKWAARQAQRDREIKALLVPNPTAEPGKRGNPSIPRLSPEEVTKRHADLLYKASCDPEPGVHELLTTNATPEAVIERVAATRRYGAFSAEGVTIFEGLAEYRDKGNDGSPAGSWCLLHSGDEVRISRKGKPALVIQSRSAILCVGTVTQPDVLERAMQKPVLQRGFMARFFKFASRGAVVPESEKLPVIDRAAIEWWDNAIADVEKRCPPEQIILKCSEAAGLLLRRFELEMRRRATNPDDLGDSPQLAAWANKAHGQALRWAAVYHALEGRGYEEPIDADLMTYAIKAMRYGLEVDIALAGGSAQTRPGRLRRLVHKIAESKAEQVRPWELARDHWCGFRKSEAALDHLRELADLGYLREGQDERSSKGGRRGVFFTVHPRLAALLESQNLSENCEECETTSAPGAAPSGGATEKPR